MILKPELADSRLKGYFVKHQDVSGTGLEQLYCVKCGKPAGGIRFDDPEKSVIEVVCDPCILKFGKPPLQECARLNK